MSLWKHIIQGIKFEFLRQAFFRLREIVLENFAQTIVSVYFVWKNSLRLCTYFLKTVLTQTVVEGLNGEPQTSWLSCISNAALLGLRLLLYVGRNISSIK